MHIELPRVSDYPPEIFKSDLPAELRVGCARAYFKANALTRELFRRRIMLACGLIPQKQWNRALDAGTGAGFLLPALSSMAREVDGVDLSNVLQYTQVMLDKRGIKNVKLQLADLMNLPFPDAAFDLVTCLSVIEHIPDPSAAFAEMARVMQPAGVLIIGYPLEHLIFRGMEWLLRLEKRIRAGRMRRHETSFHPHVSHYSRIEKAWEDHFVTDGIENVRLLGLSLYRIVKLKRK